jgi:hypothetical protein
MEEPFRIPHAKYSDTLLFSAKISSYSTFAEKEGFEPSKGFHPYQFSKLAHSTTLTFLLILYTFQKTLPLFCFFYKKCYINPCLQALSSLAVKARPRAGYQLGQAFENKYRIGLIVYRLGHCLFKARSRVRLPVRSHFKNPHASAIFVM